MNPLSTALLLWAAACRREPADTTSDLDDPPIDPADGDGDGFTDDDCDDGNPAIHPGADEHCDGADEDCDHVVDDDPVDAAAGFADDDGDGFGDDDRPLVSCDPAATVAGDCDDTDPAVHPGASDPCGAERDCDPLTAAIAMIGEAGYPTLADAVGAAVDGDAVEVCDGIVAESGIAVTADITVRSQGGDRTGCTIDGGGQDSVFVVDGASLTLQSLTVRRGRAPGNADGGAVRVVSGSLVADDCAFTSNEGTFGGAISGADIDVTSSSFTQNVGRVGGAIHSTGTLALTDSVFVENDGRTAGAVFVIGGGLTVTGGSFERNITMDSGGAIFVQQADATLNGVTFLDNGPKGYAYITAGAVFLTEGSLTIVDSSFSENDGKAGGGAIYVRSGELAVEGSTFDQNLASWGGGAMTLSDTTTEVVGSTFTGNVVLEVGNGGAIEAHDTVLTVTDTTFADNHLTYEYGLGGALYLANSPTILENTVVTGNSAVSAGGAIGVVGTLPVTLDLRGVEVSGNAAPVGGGLMVDGVSVVADDATSFVGNQASGPGGGVWLYGSSTLDVSWAGGSFVDNSASEGGAMYVVSLGARVGVSGVTADGNDAGSSGGGLYVTGPLITLEDSVFVGNTSAEAGGAVSASLGSVQVVDCTFEANEAARGGGLFVDAESTVAVVSSDFGTGILGNDPDDALVEPDQSYSGFGADATFTCASPSCDPLDFSMRVEATLRPVESRM